LAFYTILGIFLKENYLGRSYLHVDADKQLHRDARKKLNTVKPDYPNYNIDQLIE